MTDLKTDVDTVTEPLLLHAEKIAVTRRRVEGETVRVATETRAVQKAIEEALLHERVEVQHVVIGRPIDTVPAVRQEGDVTVIPVVEEILFVEKRLVLKEEVRVRRVKVPDVYREMITLREQHVVVERRKPGEPHRNPQPDFAPIPKQQALKEQPE